MSRTLGSGGYATVINQDIYEISDVQKHRLGTAVKRGDRIFKYAKAGASLDPGVLAHTYNYQHIAYTTIAVSAAIGANQLVIDVGAGDHNSGVIPAHSLEGGSLVIFDASAYPINFSILDNTATTGADEMTITLDGELPIAQIVDTDHAEVIASPYLDIRTGEHAYKSFVGVAMRRATTSDPYFWLQTWGPVYMGAQVTAGLAPGDYASSFQCVGRSDGTIQSHNVYQSSATPSGPELIAGVEQQHVGFTLAQGSADVQGAPFMMLQISV